jgi:hypothetical protein
MEVFLSLPIPGFGTLSNRSIAPRNIAAEIRDEIRGTKHGDSGVQLQLDEVAKATPERPIAAVKSGEAKDVRDVLRPEWKSLRRQDRRRPGGHSRQRTGTETLIAGALSATDDSRDRVLYEEFEAAKRIAESSSVFARVPKEERGRFPLTGRGDINTYALFAELFATLAGPRGRAGVIVPTGIATDATTAPFFSVKRPPSQGSKASTTGGPDVKRKRSF